MKMRNFLATFIAVLSVGFVLLIFSRISPVEAGSANLTWTANSEPDMGGYKIYYGTSSVTPGNCPAGYSDSYDVTDEASVSHWFDTLTAGQTYYFQLTAYDTSNNESTCSTGPGEVSKLVTYRGDINATPDHAVNINDFTLFAADYGRTSWCGPTHSTDINRDCTVNINDFTLLAAEYGGSF